MRARCGRGMRLVALLLLGVSQAGAQVGWGVYEPGQRLRGSLSVNGSDTMSNIMAAWVAAFQGFQPDIVFQLEGRGSSTAPPALIAGTVDIGVMSRPMTAVELARYRRRYGVDPLRVAVALDAIAIYVHRDNPLESITLDAIAQIFGDGGRGRAVLWWHELGVGGGVGGNAVSRFGRNSASGTYGFFKTYALMGDDFSPRVEEFPGSSALVRAVAVDRNAVGYAGIGYRTPNIRWLKVAATADQKAVFPTDEFCRSGDYPLARRIYFYLPGGLETGAQSLAGEFVRFVLSEQGQRMVERLGLYAVGRDEILKVLPLF